MPRFGVNSETRNTMVQLKKKKKTLSEQVNEQIINEATGSRNHTSKKDNNYEGMVEDYDMNFSGTDSEQENDYNNDNNNNNRKRSREVDTKLKSKASKSKSLLLKRGPLDDSFSKGKYAAKAASTASFYNQHATDGEEDEEESGDGEESEFGEDGEGGAQRGTHYTKQDAAAAVDDIFSFLDDTNVNFANDTAKDAIDLEGDEDVYLYSNEDEMTPSDEEDEDEEEGKKGSKKGKKSSKKAKKERKAIKAKDLSEEDYMNFLEAKHNRQRQGQAAKQYDRAALKELFDEDGSGDENEDGAGSSAEKSILKQLQRLRQTQLGVLGSQHAATAPAAGGGTTQEDTHVQRLQEETKRFVFLYGQLMRIRVGLQKCVCDGLRLPPYYAKTLFTSAKPEKIKKSSQPEREGENESERVMDGAVIERAYDRVTRELQSLLALFYSSATMQEDKEGAKAKTGAAAAKKKMKSKNKKRKVEGGEDGNDDDDDEDEEPKATPFESIHAHLHTKVKALADPCLSYWGDKLILKHVQTNGNSANNNNNNLKSIGQPLPVQIKNIIASQLTKMKHKIQKNNAHCVILGNPVHYRAIADLSAFDATPTDAKEEINKELYVKAKTKRAQQIAEGDFDDEIFNDETFLKELVHKSGAFSSQLEQQLASIQKQQQQQRMLHAGGGEGGAGLSHPSVTGSRVGFHKFTKGKQIQYEPRSKLVGFMVKQGFENSGRSDVIVQHLFQ